eukprot:Gb_35638 [translate_table: standard]
MGDGGIDRAQTASLCAMQALVVPSSPASSIASSHASSFGFGSGSASKSVASSTGRSLPPTPSTGRSMPPVPYAQQRPLYGSSLSFGYSESLTSDRTDFSKAKENVTVTVRFRPLSAREIQKGDEIAWYADGDTTVRNEYNSLTAYAFVVLMQILPLAGNEELLQNRSHYMKPRGIYQEGQSIIEINHNITACVNQSSVPINSAHIFDVRGLSGQRSRDLSDTKFLLIKHTFLGLLIALTSF